MRLIDLEPEWVADYSVRELTPKIGFRRGDFGIEQAQGIMFLCPVCFKKNCGPVGTETILCWFKDRGVPDDAVPGPGRWTPTGTGFDDLTLSPSVNVANEHWHGHVTNGEIVGGI